MHDGLNGTDEFRASSTERCSELRGPLTRLWDSPVIVSMPSTRPSSVQRAPHSHTFD
jgi:hypothetical protein